MPRAERCKKDSAKALAKAADKPGQSKITSLFAKGNTGHDFDSASTSGIETVITVNTEKAPDCESQKWSKLKRLIGETEKICMKTTWVKHEKDFTSEDKESSVKHGRYFQGQWLRNYEWLIKGVFGSYEVGIDNWKKGCEKFNEHENSYAHKEACLTSDKGQLSISIACSSLALETQQLRRKGLISHLQTLKHSYAKFNLDKAINDKALKHRQGTRHPGRAETDDSDESSDVSKKEQFSFSVRTCDDSYEVSEDFVGIYECLQGLLSDALLHYTKDILLRCGMEGHKMAAMSFYGASAMKSLARKLKEDIAPNAIYVHCFSHCNELIIQDAAKQSNLLSTSLDLCQSLYAIVGAHSKHILLFEEIQANFRNETGTNDYKVLRLQSLSTTRWTTRVKAAYVIFKKLAELHATLKKLQDDPSISADRKAKIRGILRRQLSSLIVIFNLNVTRKLLALFDKLSKELQAVDISAEYALFSIRHVLQRLHEMRSEEEFERTLDDAKKVFRVMMSFPLEFSENFGTRLRKVPRWMNNEEILITESLHVTDASVYNSANITPMRSSYYQAIDAIISGLGWRSEQDDLFQIKCIEKLLLNSMKERGVSLDGLSNSLIDKDVLRMQLDDLPTILGLYNADQKKKITEVTRISTIAEIFSAMPSTKKRCSEIHKLIILYYTMPLSSASCERTFSVMHRLKTWLRSNTEGNLLNDIMFSNIKKQHMDMVEIDVIAKEFSQRNERRIKYFGKYNT
ncbi:zinc finger MYM-type protein 1-like [Xenia sp. Carnegie-2017]|uniref:zinc finger MYM-type protein 1-like n=1 Tax=Xenia sp. Carnegie-2017 TaxID=2897299 RepID=UPI001F045E87|nr:zinc finger MYM-type protein 1-like [Xenia sp. Carnegie-2017]